MKLKIVSLITFLIGATLFANSVIKSQKIEQVELKTPRSFIVHYLSSRSEDGGPLTPYQYCIRAVNANGEWKETRYAFDGKVSTLIGASDGLYIVNNGFKQYFGEHRPEVTRKAMRSEQELVSSPLFARVEPLAGLKTFVLKNDAGTIESETSYSPETGITPLKSVARSKPDNDRKFSHVMEALSVEFRELTEEEAKIPTLPIRFDIAEQKIESLRQAGQLQIADNLKQNIAQLKAQVK